MTKYLNFSLIAASILLWSCQPNSDETTTSGHITIVADESFSPIVDTQLQTFKAQYKDVYIRPVYMPEEEAIAYFLADSARLVFSTRNLYPSEIKKLEAVKIFPKTNHVATDAIALIVHPDNPDSLLTEKQIKAMLEGTTQKWSQLSKTNKAGEITMVFDHNASSNLRYMNEHFGIQGKTKGKIYAAGGHLKVLDYVKNNKNAIGVIGVNWVSDKDDPQMLHFLKGIRVVGISSKEKPTTEDDYYQPFQAYMATGDYPLTRKLFIISREPKTGLGTGFSAFVCSDKGQRIILKSGIYPANAPIRIIKLKKQ
jgi:phosphate transport system substrate-binding protein